MVKAIQKLALMVMALCLMAPITSFAGEWKEDSKGWWVQSDDGTYLTNQWYQSPESGLYYYLGADGYMLVNAITPDGYQVDANGVWNPSVTSTQHVTNGQIDTPSTNNNSNNSNNNSSGYYNEDGYWISTDIIDPNDYDPHDIGGATGWHAGEFNAY